MVAGVAMEHASRGGSKRKMEATGMKGSKWRLCAGWFSDHLARCLLLKLWGDFSLATSRRARGQMLEVILPHLFVNFYIFVKWRPVEVVLKSTAAGHW